MAIPCPLTGYEPDTVVEISSTEVTPIHLPSRGEVSAEYAISSTLQQNKDQDNKHFGTHRLDQAPNTSQSNQHRSDASSRRCSKNRCLLVCSATCRLGPTWMNAVREFHSLLVSLGESSPYEAISLIFNVCMSDLASAEPRTDVLKHDVILTCECEVGTSVPTCGTIYWIVWRRPRHMSRSEQLRLLAAQLASLALGSSRQSQSQSAPRLFRSRGLASALPNPRMPPIGLAASSCSASMVPLAWLSRAALQPPP